MMNFYLRAVYLSECFSPEPEASNESVPGDSPTAGAECTLDTPSHQVAAGAECAPTTPCQQVADTAAHDSP